MNVYRKVMRIIKSVQFNIVCNISSLMNLHQAFNVTKLKLYEIHYYAV